MIQSIAAVQAAIKAALRRDVAVIAAFAQAPVKVYDLVPANAVAPYLVVSLPTVSPIEAEGFDLAELEFTVHVWSRPDPPSVAEALALATAVEAVLDAVQVPAGVTLYAALPVRTVPLIDPSDARTVHVIVTFRFTSSPA